MKASSRTPTVTLSIRALAKACGMSEIQVARSLQVLEQRGHLKRTSNASGEPSYELKLKDSARD